MDKFLEFLIGFNAQMIIVMTIVLWYFVREVKKEIHDEIKLMNQQADKQSARTDKLYEMFVDLLKDGKKR